MQGSISALPRLYLLFGAGGGILPVVTPLEPSISKASWMAAAMSLDTESLQATSGPPHGLGVFCLLRDPTAMAADQFARKLDRLKNAIRPQPGTRLPGTKRQAQGEFVVDCALWELAQSLAEGTASGDVTTRP